MTSLAPCRPNDLAARNENVLHGSPKKQDQLNAKGEWHENQQQGGWLSLQSAITTTLLHFFATITIQNVDNSVLVNARFWFDVRRKSSWCPTDHVHTIRMTLTVDETLSCICAPLATTEPKQRFISTHEKLELASDKSHNEATIILLTAT